MSQIRLDPDLSAKLLRLGQSAGRSLTNIANLILRRHLGMKASPPACPERTAGQTRIAKR